MERKAKKARKNKKLARVPRNVMRGVFTLSLEKERVCIEGYDNRVGAKSLGGRGRTQKTERFILKIS